MSREILLLSVRLRNAWDKSTSFRFCSSLSIQGIHRAQNLWYPKLSVKLLSTVILEISGTISQIFPAVKRRSLWQTLLSVPRSRRKWMDVPCSAHRGRLFGPSKVPCNIFLTFSIFSITLGPYAEVRFRWISLQWVLKRFETRKLNTWTYFVLGESGLYPLQRGWLLCQDWAL